MSSIIFDYLFLFILYVLNFDVYDLFYYNVLNKSQKIVNKKATFYMKVAFYLRGVDGGIRTLAPVTQPTSLAGKPLEPLEYVDIYQGCYIIIAN